MQSAPESKEFEIDRNDPNGFDGFFDFIHKNIVNSYKGEFQKFIGKTTARKLGYKIN